MTPQEPLVRVREAVPADVDDIIHIHYSAFDDDVMNELMHPGGATEESRKKFGERVFPKEDTSADAAKKGKDMLYVAEYFPEGEGTPGQVIAFAKWTLYKEPRAEEDWKNENFVPTAENFGTTANLSVIDAFIGELHRKQRDCAKGEAGLYLGILACRPDRQRLGAGSALLKFGADFADILELPSWLESSPVGYRVYKKFGYEDIDVVDLKVTERWGKTKSAGRYWGENNAVEIAGPVPEGVMRSVIMRRPAKAFKGL
ncbi:hypothetical protein QBC35DRAFT_99517 [Podospora australis]|uniref:N-acetyltransferase domain-containing protein n=1 Tax=Podospora australis TaxID=1536484 RepID=A0AAN6X4M7_9PEZI|nr:hypothetical protein QBC35DRAFT_99517 [Podospora australis]